MPLDGIGTVPYGIVEVPEPASATLIACGCALLLMRGRTVIQDRRKKHRKTQINKL